MHLPFLKDDTKKLVIFSAYVEVVSEAEKLKLQNFRRRLGKRRWRIFRLKELKDLNQEQIAARMRISQPMVCKDLKVIERIISERREKERAHRRSIPTYFPRLSLN